LLAAGHPLKATSDVTGASASPLFSGKYAFLQRVTGDNERHAPTGNDPFSQLLVTHLLTQWKSARVGRLLNHCRRKLAEIAQLLIRNVLVRFRLYVFSAIYGGIRRVKGHHSGAVDKVLGKEMGKDFISALRPVGRASAD
jgi:hypothetical protein